MKKYKNLQQIFDEFMEDLKFNPDIIINTKNHKPKYGITKMLYIENRIKEFQGVYLVLGNNNCKIKINTYNKTFSIIQINPWNDTMIEQDFEIQNPEIWTKINELVH